MDLSIINAVGIEAFQPICVLRILGVEALGRARERPWRPARSSLGRRRRRPPGLAWRGLHRSIQPAAGATDFSSQTSTADLRSYERGWGENRNRE
ncbi:hypothetical protein RRG08_067076 [Elysia crispata]|uniref:Uncharacterized protein n=1 Tax=Elysia crispata TaxID=231223 RepID=A0AAE1B886_9GAST|nr:hypothetical protein RRG08_067076 [Elysia crispata]